MQRDCRQGPDGVLRMHSNWECFRDAVLVLAGGGPVKQRLTEAYQSHLRDLDPDELPRDVRGAYAALVTALQSGQRVGTLDAIAASVRKMSEADAARHAQSIVHMFADWQEPPAASRPAALLRAVPSTDEEIPAFLNRA
jgi:hypothetical protein